MQKLASMNQVTVDKIKLLEKLNTNRAKHLEKYETAIVGYKKEVAEFLEARLEEAKEGKFVSMKDMPDQPTSHIDDYNDAISMLEFCEDKQIALEDHDFKTYVLDKWSWKKRFETSNSKYF